jgi:hypothetical protein
MILVQVIIYKVGTNDGKKGKEIELNFAQICSTETEKNKVSSSNARQCFLSILDGSTIPFHYLVQPIDVHRYHIDSSPLLVCSFLKQPHFPQDTERPDFFICRMYSSYPHSSVRRAAT